MKTGESEGSQRAPVELVVRSHDDRLGAAASDDSSLVASAYELVADVVIVAATQALDDQDAHLSDTSHSTLRHVLTDRIQLRSHGWGSWQALFAVPPDTVVWVVHELGLALAADLVVRIGERAVDRLRNGNVDRDLIEGELSERESTFDLYFPSGNPMLRLRRRSRSTVIRGGSRLQINRGRGRTVHPTRRKGKKPKRK